METPSITDITEDERLDLGNRIFKLYENYTHNTHQELIDDYLSTD